MEGDPPPEDFDYGERRADGQFERHPTTDEGEFVQPVRESYVHDDCGGVTTMRTDIAESFARDPTQYSKTFCSACGDYYPVDEFTWEGSDQRLDDVGPEPAADDDDADGRDLPPHPATLTNVEQVKRELDAFDRASTTARKDTSTTMTRQQVRSNRVASFTGLTIADKAIGAWLALLSRFIQGAGAKSEAATERDGFLSYYKESHAAIAGIGTGFLAVASGDLRVFGLVLNIVVYGNRGERFLDAGLLHDIRAEKQYFLGGLIVGVLLALPVRLLMGVGLPLAGVIPGA